MFVSREENESVIEGITVAGGKIYCKNSKPAIINCVISNKAGHGIFCDSSSPIITNCTLINNKNYAVYAQNNSSPTLVNSIVWANKGSIYKDSTSSVTAAYSDIQQSSGVYVGSGNINANPIFAATGDYHLTAKSPCVNAGVDDKENYPYLPDNDADRENRPQAVKSDMGADEFAIEPTALISSDNVVYRTGETLYASPWIIASGSFPVTTDVYIGLILPTGVKLYYPGWTTIPEAALSSQTLVNWGPKVLFSYTFNDTDPKGVYSLEISIIDPLTDKVMGRSNSTAFSFMP